MARSELYGIGADPVYSQLYDQMLQQRMRGLGSEFAGGRRRLTEMLGGTGMYGSGYMGQALQNLMSQQSAAKAGAYGDISTAYLQNLAQLREAERQRQFEREMTELRAELAQPSWTSGFGQLIGAVGSALPYLMAPATGGTSLALGPLASGATYGLTQTRPYQGGPYRLSNLYLGGALGGR